ncbi:hypothetical protein cyc_07656 [Cyclospora cayetanensis]|uniref:Uncharacterized protein n=1 Tax=Cyclospora cayetanensis TaxID=88456 RepID=A0A1D3D304_9EIME|nr:hypothetical protein cyc_07656 [Cyclospora cayetanensis]
MSTAAHAEQGVLNPPTAGLYRLQQRSSLRGRRRLMDLRNQPLRFPASLALQQKPPEQKFSLKMQQQRQRKCVSPPD